MNSNYFRLQKTLYKTNCIMVPRYELWLSRSYWNISEAAFLFNGVDPLRNQVVEAKLGKDGELAYDIRYLTPEDAEGCGLKRNDLIRANMFLENIFWETCAMLTWKVPNHPLILTNRYLQKIGNVPRQMLKQAKRAFLELYQRRNDNDEIRAYWNDNWHNNIAAPFLQLIANEDIHTKKEESEQPNINQIADKARIAEQNYEKEQVKIILEESAEAREKRVCTRGYEIYKHIKEQHPNKKITKEFVAEQIMKEEEPLYKRMAAKNLSKKQPALGTYLKELRKIR